MPCSCRDAGRPKLLWLGAPFFAPSLTGLDWELALHRRYEPDAVSWRDLFQGLPHIPDVLVISDFSGPPPLLDPCDCPCLTVFYSVDSHIHSWHPLYAQAFDLCLVSLKDHVPLFAGPFLSADRILWSPPFAKDDCQAKPGQVVWDALFVGKVDSDLTPRRHAALQALAGRMQSLHVCRGNFRTLFPKARVVLNFCDRGDLNFRVFEALACGSALLTPRIGHGLTELFTPGQDLWLYEPGPNPVDPEDPEEVDDLHAQLRFLLANPDTRQALARNGLAKVNAGHRARHRAEAFTRWLRSRSWPDLVHRRRQLAKTMHADIIRPLLLHISDAQQRGSTLRERYYRAACRLAEVQTKA